MMCRSIRRSAASCGNATCATAASRRTKRPHACRRAQAARSRFESRLRWKRARKPSPAFGYPWRVRFELHEADHILHDAEVDPRKCASRGRLPAPIGRSALAIDLDAPALAGGCGHLRLSCAGDSAARQRLHEHRCAAFGHGFPVIASGADPERLSSRSSVEGVAFFSRSADFVDEPGDSPLRPFRGGLGGSECHEHFLSPENQGAFHVAREHPGERDRRCDATARGARRRHSARCDLLLRDDLRRYAAAVLECVADVPEVLRHNAAAWRRHFGSGVELDARGGCSTAFSDMARVLRRGRARRALRGMGSALLPPEPPVRMRANAPFRAHHPGFAEPLLWVRAAIVLAATVAGLVALFVGPLPQAISASAFFVLTFAPGLIERYCFFTASDAPRMPGGIAA